MPTTYGIENISYMFPYEPYIPPDEPPPDGGGGDPELPPVEHIFTTQVPTTTNLTDAAYTLGTVFKTDVDGQVVGVRFYVGTIPNGLGMTPAISLFQWIDEATGTLLASKSTPVAGMTADSWNEVLFDTPIDVVAEQNYVTCWTTDNYNVSSHFFDGEGEGASDVVNGHLTALHKIASRGNGKFYVSSTVHYPDGEFNASCYFVDVLFQPPAVP